MTTEAVSVKMVLPDATEVAAKFVLRDKDLDLAFIRPSEKLAKPIAAIDLSKNAKPGILDEVVVLTRLGKVANRVPSVSVHRIQAVVTKPRTMYVAGENATESGLGAPVFGLDGNLTGILLLRSMESQGVGMGAMFSGMSGLGLLAVILPADDIIEVAKQASEAPEEEKKEEEKKPEEKKQPEGK